MKRKDKIKLRYLLLLLFFIGICIPRGIQLYKWEKKLNFYLSEIERLKKENENLKNKIEKIKNDPYYVEKIARENFGLMKNEEVLFKINK